MKNKPATPAATKVILEFYSEIWYCYAYENGSMDNPLFTSTSYELAEAEATHEGYEIVQVIAFEDEEGEKAEEDGLPTELALGISSDDDAQIIMETGEHICFIERSPSYEIAEEIIKRYNEAPQLKKERDAMLLVLLEVQEYFDYMGGNNHACSRDVRIKLRDLLVEIYKK